ncbi:MAG: T9SS type A sorting domain-containing protein [candidate division WOR-3 bacterium]|nr:T9SS type A sorting domain-containing protein [candidate division WOR-3 bacterium]MDH5684376.1 T9SS type A sorting domain-containing protein [candidate division WOR-3 bacterium]
MKKSYVLLFLILAVACLATTHQVDMVNFAFIPDTLSIYEGDSVLWINQSNLFHTTTSGDTGVPNGIWDSGSIAPGDSFLFHFVNAGTYPYYCTPHWQFGIIRLIISAPADIRESKSDFSFKHQTRQNYPNPLSSYTYITYQLKKPGRVVIRIYDATGQPIRNFIKQHNAPGNYSIIWNGHDEKGQKVSAGIYFYQVNLAGTSYTQKMLVNK